jgi:hypothetical protein
MNIIECYQLLNEYFNNHTCFNVKKNRKEVILKGSNDRVNGMIVTDGNEYSVDFIMRWLEFGFVKLEGG